MWGNPSELCSFYPKGSNAVNDILEKEIDRIGHVSILDPDSEAPEPTGEGLSKRECQNLLIQELNGLINQKNIARLKQYGKLSRQWEEEGFIGSPPKSPIIVKGYSRRRLNLAVCSARRKGILKTLLGNAGYRV